MKTLIGLGNPGKEYEHTRHNIGFLVVDALAKQLDARFTPKRAIASEIAQAQWHGERLLIVKPQTFMNASGKSVAALLNKFPVKPAELLVIYDDADLPFGDVRLKTNGSSAGHRGMESILTQLPKKTAVARLRIGIGRPQHKDVPLETFVLQPWRTQETDALPSVIALALEKIETFL
ncbi:aminoacyl-tRNA hydrolase [Candidatus Uhrbacteria bacterium]|nr:aminoacyl-tRNA hydrolase [Candidatus Uhrbacteria bacterium]